MESKLLAMGEDVRRFAVWLFTSLAICMGAALGFGSSAQAASLRESCQHLLFSSKAKITAALPDLPRSKTSKASALVKMGQKFIFDVRSGNIRDGRTKLVEKLSPKWIPIFRNRLKKLGFYEDEYNDSYNGEVVFVLNRGAILKLHPDIVRLVPADIVFVFRPFSYVLEGVAGSFDRKHRTIAVPITILDSMFATQDIFIIAHEAVHMRLDELRRKQNHRRFGYQFEVFDDNWVEIYKLIGPLYADLFVNEEIFAYLVDALNDFEYICANPHSLEDIDGIYALRTSQRFIKAYLDYVVPDMHQKIDPRNIRAGENVIVFSTEGSTSRALLYKPNPGDISKDDEKIQFDKDMSAEKEIFNQLNPLILELDNRVAKDKFGACGHTEKLWAFLKTQGLDPAIFRLQKQF